MKHYTVIVTRDVSQSAQVYVSAKDEEAAGVRAMELDADQYEWEHNEPPVKGEVYVTDISPDNV